MLGIKGVTQNTFWMLLERFIAMLAALLSGILIARFLGPAQYGSLNYVLSFVSLFAALSMLGLEVITIHDLVQQPAQYRTILGTTFILKLTGAVVAIILILLATLGLQTGSELRILILIFAASYLFQSFLVIDFFFQSQTASRYAVYAKLLATLTGFSLKIIGIVTGAKIGYFVSVFAIEAAVLCVLLIIIYEGKYRDIFSWKFDFTRAKSVMRQAAPLMLSSILVSVYMRIDQLMLREFMDLKAVGIYSAAVKLSEAFYVFPAVITAAIFPAILQFRVNDYEQYMLKTRHLFVLLSRLSLIICVALSIGSYWIIPILYGHEYDAAAIVLSIHIWSCVFVFLNISSSRWFTAESLNRFILLRAGVAAITNIVLNLLMIPAYGIIGAAIANVISWAISGYLLDALYPPAKKLFILKTRSLMLRNSS